MTLIKIFIHIIRENKNLTVKEKMSLIKIEKMISINPFDSVNYFCTTIYIGLLITGTFGNLFVIFLNPLSIKGSKASIVASTFLSTIHLILLYLNSFDFVKIDRIGNLFIESIIGCRTINIIYRSLLLLEPWQEFFYL